MDTRKRKRPTVDLWAIFLLKSNNLYDRIKTILNYCIYKRCCFSQRYQESLKGEEFNDIDHELQRQAHDFYHRMENSIVASDSWYETSCKNYNQYWYCEGDNLLNWKGKGYITVFDLLQVLLMNSVYSNINKH